MKISLLLLYLTIPLLVGCGSSPKDNTRPILKEKSLVTVVNNSYIFITLSKTDLDGDNLEYTIVTNPKYGVVEVNNYNKIIKYTPNDDYIGGDIFSYRANDGMVDSNIVTQNIEVGYEEGALCDDENYFTINDRYENNICQGKIRIYEDGVLCEDGNPLTINDIYTDNICQGEQITYLDGTVCEDQNPLTINDVYTNNICEGVPITYPDGTVCDDQNPLTINDIYTNNICQGVVPPNEEEGNIYVSINPGESLLESSKKIVFVGDSLTDNYYYDSYVNYVVGYLDLYYEQNVGYIPFNYGISSAKKYDGYYGRSTANFKEMWTESMGSFQYVPYTHSPDGKGTYIENGSGSDYVLIHFNSIPKMNTARIYYLKQPGGGTFNFHMATTSVSERLTIDTNSQYYQLGWTDIPIQTGSETFLRVYASAVLGKVALYGILGINNTPTTNSYEYSVFARSGVRLKDFTILSNAATDRYYKDIDPGIVIVNLGTNDVFNSTEEAPIGVSEYRSRMNMYINKIKGAKADTKIILLEPPEPKYLYSTGNLLEEYKDARREMAVANGWGYIDTPSNLGSYDNMNSISAMQDGIHPNSKGKSLIGLMVLSYLNNIE